MSIYFLRHLKTHYNQLDLISGCSDIDILPNQKLTYDTAIPDKFDIILSSPLTRCHNTLELLPKNLYYTINFTPILLGRNVGILKGVPRAEAISKYPELFCNGKLDVNAKIPDAESINDVANRLNNIVTELKSLSQTKNILICSHNQTLKVLYSLLKNVPITNDYWLNVNFKNGTLINIDDLKF